MDIRNELQHFSLIPRLGYWTYDKDIDEFYWSKETCMLIGWPLTHPSPKLKEFIEIIHEQDRGKIIDAIKQLYTHSSDGYGHEMRIIDKSHPGHYNWYHVIGKANNNITFGIIIDINKRKAIEKKNEQLHKQLLIFAKQAGMAEVAISVIHNIGNVLNSATTSISFLNTMIQKTSYKKLQDVLILLKKNKSSLTNYLNQDPKGKKIPEYLIVLGDIMNNEYENIVKEIHNISECIHHIKDIICTQESISSSCALTEEVYLPEILDTAIHFADDAISKKNIIINKNFDNISTFVDKSKLMQILINLIKNAIDSVTFNKEQPRKEISITINKSSDVLITITITDNGLGISQENINKIFFFGFTTKPNGHGFGLHNSALKAKELGGSLYAKSDGIGKGAAFILTLPFKLKDNNQLANKYGK